MVSHPFTQKLGQRWCIAFWVLLTDERRLSLYPAGTIVRVPHHLEFQHAASRIWTCTEPEFRLCWMKLCSSDNHYTINHGATININSNNIYNIHQAITYQVRWWDAPFKLNNPATVTKPALHTQQKTNNAKSFTGKVGQRQDVTKTSDSCSTKSDGELLPTRFGT